MLEMVDKWFKIMWLIYGSVVREWESLKCYVMWCKVVNFVYYDMLRFYYVLWGIKRIGEGDYDMLVN